MLEKERFNFGKNWKSFFNTVYDENIYSAEKSLKTLLNMESLKGKTFLDIGSGSGLFSLAARNLGAKVTSFDYDPESVECTKEMKRKFANGDSDWEIKRGSVLDKHFLTTLRKFDILYSWGVLHHTGDLWQALENITTCLKERGTLVISLYNDQGGSSRRWLLIKKIYN